MELKRLKRRLDIFYTAMQCPSFASSFVIYLYITVILQEKGFTNTEIGLTLALGSGLSIVLPPLIAALYARHPKWPLRLVAACIRIVTLVFSLLLIPVSSPVVLVSLIVIIISATTISVNPFVNAMAMQYENVGVAVNYGVARAFGSLGCALMAYASGLLSTHFGGTTAVIVASVILLAITTVFTLIFPVPERTVEAAKTARPTPPVSGAFGFRLLKKPANVMFALVMLLIWANMGVLDTYQVNILQSVGGGDMDIGLMLMIMAACEAPSMLFFKPLARRFNYARLMTAGFVFMVVKDVVLIFAGSVTDVIAAQFINLGTTGLFLPASVYYANELAGDGEAVQAQALFGGTAMAIGRIIGNVLGGVILDGSSITVLMLVCIVYAVASIVLMLLSSRLHRKEKRLAALPVL